MQAVQGANLAYQVTPLLLDQLANCVGALCDGAVCALGAQLWCGTSWGRPNGLPPAAGHQGHGEPVGGGRQRRGRGARPPRFKPTAPRLKVALRARPFGYGPATCRAAPRAPVLLQDGAEAAGEGKGAAAGEQSTLAQLRQETYLLGRVAELGEQLACALRELTDREAQLHTTSDTLDQVGGFIHRVPLSLLFSAPFWACVQAAPTCREPQTDVVLVGGGAGAVCCRFWRQKDSFAGYSGGGCLCLGG